MSVIQRMRATDNPQLLIAAIRNLDPAMLGEGPEVGFLTEVALSAM